MRCSPQGNPSVILDLQIFSVDDEGITALFNSFKLLLEKPEFSNREEEFFTL